MASKNTMLAFFVISSVVAIIVVVVDGCILMQHGWEPKTVEERTSLADIIVSGTVLRVLRNKRAWDGTYPADVLVADVYKGFELFDNSTALKASEIQEEYRSYHPFVYRVERFGDRRQCWAEVKAGRNYILFLTTDPSPRDLEVEGEVDMSPMMMDSGLQLVATYDDIAGASIEFSEETEENLLNILGWRPWVSWSSCSEECGGGQQTRRRVCVQDVANACEGEAKQKRPCNTFNCDGIRDMKKNFSLESFPHGVRRAPGRWSAYRISHQAKYIRVPTSNVYGKRFPYQFTVLLTIKPKLSPRRKNRGDSYALLFTTEDGAVEFGIKIAESPSVVYRLFNGLLRELIFTDYVLDRSWHHLAFSVTKHNVTLIADCRESMTLDIDRSDRAPIDETGVASIGPGRSVVSDVYFEGDIDQLVIINDPLAAEMQCDHQERRFPDMLDIDPSTLQSSSVNGMDASIDIDLVYNTLFNPMLFIDATTESPLVDTTFPSFYYDLDSVTTEDPTTTTASALEATTPAIMERLAERKTTQPATKLPMHRTSTVSTPPKFTIRWDNSVVESYASQVDFGVEVREPVTPIEFGAEGIATIESDIDIINGRTERPEDAVKQDKSYTTPTMRSTSTTSTTKSTVSSSTTTATTRRTVSSTTEPTTTKSKPSKRTSIPTTPTTATTVSSTFKSTTTSPKSKTTPSITTLTTTTKMTTTVAPPAVQSTMMNNIVGDEVIDNNSEERPLNDGAPGPIYNSPNGGAPAEIPRPSVQEYGQPVDDMGNWSSWSTCSRTCGTGTRYRYTMCEPGSPLPDCRNGGGIAAQHKACRLDNDCQATLRWSDWSDCSRTCGSGFETRVAICRDKEAHRNCTEVGKMLIERRMCQDLQECSQNYCPNGCLNGGVCTAEGVCQCPDGFEGRMCELARCNPPCQNNGRCLHPGRCFCPRGFNGPACNQPICQKGCQNGGVCVAPDQCRCRAGYTGPDCRQPECSPPCANGGECIRAGYCRCPTGYRGMQCHIAYCRRTCLNGGRCTGADTCSCQRGYTGSICQQSECPRGCPRGTQCVGPNRCTVIRHNSPSSSNRQNPALSSSRNKSPSSSRQAWCPLQSYREEYIVTYIKPAIQKYRVPCGPYNLKTCESSRIIYQIGYRKSQRTAYKCAPYG